MIEALLKYSFLQNAFIGSILASIACGIIGTIIIEKKLVMMSGGIAHTSFGGVGMGYFLNIEPIIGALVFSISAALGIAVINKKSRTNTDVLMGIFWSMGMAAGVLFIAFTPGYPPDISSYLFGDILAVAKLDLKIMIVLDIVVIFIITSLYNQITAYLFDDEFASVVKIKTVLLEYMIYILIAITVVVLIRVVGIVLILALLTTPTAVAKLFTYDLKKIILLSIFLGMIFCLIGLWLSYELQIPSGSSIIMVAGLTYFITSMIKGRYRLKSIKS